MFANALYVFTTRCTAPQSRDEPIPAGGRVPLCLHLCIIPLVTCPGFWIGDIIGALDTLFVAFHVHSTYAFRGTCTMVSVPPMCTQAFYWNLVHRIMIHYSAATVVCRAQFRLPPQYASFGIPYMCTHTHTPPRLCDHIIYL